MGFKSFKRFQELLKRGYVPKRIGFSSKIDSGDINRLNTRLRLVKEFKGLHLEGFSKPTVLGYEAFFRIFLAHSTLERFLDAVGLKLDDLEPYLVQYNAKEVTAIIQTKDKDRKLYDFLHDKLNDKLKQKLHNCYDGECMNYAYVSASIRHIFAHGYLSANVNGVNPKNIDTICAPISDNLIDFMDSEFTKKIDYGFEKMSKNA